MSNADSCQLTTKDYTILEVMLERHAGRDETLAGLLRRKLAHALVTFRDDIPADVVTLSSRVTYRVDGGPAETRIVAHDDMRGLVGMLLPITHPRGLALLGLAEGQSISLRKEDGSRETLTVQEVVYQPEAARREAASLGQETAEPAQRRGPMLRVVHRADSVAQPPARQTVTVGFSGFDDPGPSAA